MVSRTPYLLSNDRARTHGRFPSRGRCSRASLRDKSKKNMAYKIVDSSTLRLYACHEVICCNQRPVVSIYYFGNAGNHQKPYKGGRETWRLYVGNHSVICFPPRIGSTGCSTTRFRGSSTRAIWAPEPGLPRW